MIAVGDDNQVVAAFVGEAQNGFGRVAAAGFTKEVDSVLRGHFLDFALSRLEVFVRRFSLLLVFAGQIGMARQQLTHPKGAEVGVESFGQHRRALQRGLAAFGAVVTDKDFFEHNVSLSRLRRLARFFVVDSFAVNFVTFDHRFNRGLEKFLRDERRHERAENDDGDEHGVLGLVNDMVLQAEQRGDGAERQPGGHQQRGVIRLAVAHVKNLGERPHPDEFRHHFYQQQNHDDTQRRQQGGQRDEKPRLDEIKRREDRERDGAHPVHERFVAQEHARDDEADQIGGQHRFAFSGGRQPAEKKQHEEDELYFRLAHARRAKFGDDELGPLRHEPKHHRRDYHENYQPDVEVGKK